MSGQANVKRKPKPTSKRTNVDQMRKKAQPKKQKPAQKAVSSAKANVAAMDSFFFGTVIVMVLFGLLMLYSASYVSAIYRFGNSFHYFGSQFIFAAMGIVVMYIASKVDYHFIRKFAWPAMAVTYLLLVVVLFMPPISDATRWIFLGPNGKFGTFQPSEIAKFTVILLFADIIAKNHKKMRSRDLKESFMYEAAPFVIILLPMVLLLLLEPHVSATVIILLLSAILMFIGGTSLKWFAAAGAIGIVGYSAAVSALKGLAPYVTSRVQMWLDPFSDASGKGHQTIQSLLAIGSGGLSGLGLGNSRQKHLYVPEPQNDFIFSIICEELGFIGAMLVIGLFVVLLIRGIHIALTAKDYFGTMLVVGIMAQVTLQAVLNIAVVTNSIPNTGISLPFFSYGGTSLLMLLGEMGIVLSVSRQCKKPASEEEEANT